MISATNSCNSACVSKTCSFFDSSFNSYRRDSLGSTLPGPQIKAARNPSSCSKFMDRLSSKRSRKPLSLSNSAAVNGCAATGRLRRSHTIQPPLIKEVTLSFRLQGTRMARHHKALAIQVLRCFTIRHSSAFSRLRQDIIEFTVSHCCDQCVD